MQWKIDIIYHNFFQIKGLFLDFIAGIFEAYDENKHFKTDSNLDNNFNEKLFIENSDNSIRPFLEIFIYKPVIILNYLILNDFNKIVYTNFYSKFKQSC